LNRRSGLRAGEVRPDGEVKRATSGEKQRATSGEKQRAGGGEVQRRRQTEFTV
jgi:hypothetical protein